MRFCLAALAVTAAVMGGVCAPAAAQPYPAYPPPANVPPNAVPGEDDDIVYPPYPPSQDPYGPRSGLNQPPGPSAMVPVEREEARPSPYGAEPPTGAIGARPPAEVEPGGDQPTTAALPPEVQPETGQAPALPPQFRRQVVDYQTKEQPGTIVIDTPNTYLYLVLGQGKALRYGIGVGREGFTWSGIERIRKMSEWPDWFPPAEMIERQPYLPRMMAGGPGNPLGARALYLGNTLYRIHGTNQPSTIGQTVSSGCIRLTNDDIEDLYGRVTVGSKVVVMPGRSAPTAPTAAAAPATPVH